MAIVRKGERPEFWFVIVSGWLRFEGEQSKRSKEAPDSGLLGAGSYFGEDILILNRKSKATVTAQGEAVVLRINKEGFERHLGPVRTQIDRQFQAGMLL
jgi:CRP-like cAMP-binding protein